MTTQHYDEWSAAAINNLTRAVTEQKASDRLLPGFA